MSSKIAKFIRNIAEFIRNQVFPIPGKSAELYTRRYEGTEFVAAFESLKEIAREIGIEQSDYLLSHAQKYLSEEDDRGGSIMSRAQALLVAQTFKLGSRGTARPEIYSIINQLKYADLQIVIADQRKK